jgi:hypothetical protein
MHEEGMNVVKDMFIVAANSHDVANYPGGIDEN